VSIGTVLVLGFRERLESGETPYRKIGSRTPRRNDAMKLMIRWQVHQDKRHDVMAAFGAMDLRDYQSQQGSAIRSENARLAVSGTER
jgi:hypothetical protein